MTSAAEKILAESLQLPLEDRRRIARELWNGLPEESQFEFDDEFWEEMDRRHKELEEHPEIALTHEKVMANVREAIRRVSKSEIPSCALD